MVSMSNTVPLTVHPTLVTTTEGQDRKPVTISERKVPVTVEAHDHGDFVATTLTMAEHNEDGYGKLDATAFDHDGLGSHLGVNAHGVTAITIEDGMFGPVVKFRTASGLTLHVTAFAARTGAPSADPRTDERVDVVITDERA